MPIVNRVADFHDEIKTWRQDITEVEVTHLDGTRIAVLHL